ncbi:zinc finger protein 836-like [Malaya genurostris]|uniref:zinc finger protein 836-like n=1 Tax=Malaya genurostris TaxID=325434 RepID=UPI0026F3E54D|nr:zinc finger protein 836-like [Malaya genurostris]
MDIDKICRLCCKTKCKLYSIHEAYGDYSLKELFSDILRIEVASDDELPQNICRLCQSTLTKMHETIEAFRENDRMLRLQNIGGMIEVDIKEEIIDIDEIEQNNIAQELQVDVIEEEIMSIEENVKYEVEACNLPLYDENIEEWLHSDCENEPEIDRIAETHPTEKSRSKKTRKRTVFSQKRIRSQQSQKGTTNIPRRRNRGHRRLPEFKCYICQSDSLGTAEALLAHLNAHIDKVPYTCTECVMETVVISKVTTLNIHLRMHKNPYKCPHCDRRYHSEHAIDTHVQMYHLGDNAPCPSPCEQCGKICASKLSLKRHQRLHTSGATCELCGKLFIGRNKLQRHIERKHQKLKKYECHLCKKKLCSLDSVQVHIKTMHSTMEVKCDYCGKSYPSENSLRYHLNKHEKDPNSKFSYDWKEYYTYVEAEVGSKPESRLKKCNLCGTVVKAISPHMLTVHFPKEYRCELCDAVFKRKTLFNIHMFEHEHGKAYKCPICGKEYSEKKNLLSHLKTKKHRDHPLAKSLDWLDAKRAPNTKVQVIRNDLES